jgi:4-amino-4-deoxy-L-arabinose transferase-like glycosyltransferase
MSVAAKTSSLIAPFSIKTSFLSRRRSIWGGLAPILPVCVWCGFLFFYGLNSGEFYRTEGLRAILGAECLLTGNWVVPTLYGEPLLTKPPGMYAAMALVSWPIGRVTEWSARLPSALAATITVFLFYWYFTRQLGRLGGFIVAMILPASFMWLDKASAAEIDMMQVAWVSAAILFFFRAVEVEDEPGNGGLRWWLFALGCVAGGVLTKWTAPAFFYGTAIPLLWWRRRLRLLVSRGHLLGVLLAMAVCSTWLATVAARAGWNALYETVGREAFLHLSPARSHRPYPWLETLVHPVRVLGMNLPWSAFMLLTLRPQFHRGWDERGRRLLQGLHCWLWPNLVFWSLVPEHSARHSFPLFPAIAGLAAMVWLAWFEGRLIWPARFHVSPAWALVGIILVWVVVKVVFVEVVSPARNHHRDPRQKAEVLASHVPANQLLYLFDLKDEGIMFYYGRAVRRLADPSRLPSPREPMYCILTKSEWQRWPAPVKPEALEWLTDEQGDAIVVVKTQGSQSPGN